MNFSVQSHPSAARATLAAATALLGIAGCDRATPPQAMPSTPPAAIAQAPTMQTGVEAIKACKAGGLDEASCTQVYHDMMAGRPPQGAATFADCEAKYGAGQCGNRSVPNASGTGSVFLPLVAGAALGALGGYLLSKNLAPKGAYVPPTDWLKSRPSISAPQNPVLGAGLGGTATGAAAKVGAYAQSPGVYKMGEPKVAGTTGATATQFTPPAGGAKTSAAMPPAAQSASSFKQGGSGSPYAASGGNSTQYGSSGGYNYRAPKAMRPGARSLGQRR